jgi:AcrR family transcriptional regulator
MGATRKYELKRRAERQRETRERIVAAAADLHTSVGPAKTTISAIADRAGVQRHTVYAHFPDDLSLFRACSSHWRAAHPFPDSTSWLAEPDGERALRAALRDVYAWYERVENDLALFLRDSDATPEQTAENAAAIRRLRDELARKWTRRPRAALVAAIGHALDFETWRSLVRRQGLRTSEAAELAVGLARSTTSG